jgi:hypothetical protein
MNNNLLFHPEYVKDCYWENAENTLFSCTVKYEEFPEEMPAGITLSDPYAHIQLIWNNAMAGMYGPIAAYVPPPPPEPIPPTAEQNKNKAIRLLEETDWTAAEDVGNSQVANPYLVNQAEFLTYRSTLREIAVNPTAGFITWPIKPTEQWSS